MTNTLYQLGAKLVSTISTLVLSILITRVLGARTWGEYSVVISYMTFFYVFTEFGLNGIAAREFSKKKVVTYKDFFAFFASRFLITLIVIGVGIIALNYFNYPQHLKNAIYISQIGILFFSLGSSFNAIFQAKHSYKYLFFITLVGVVVSLTAVVAVITANPSNIAWLFVPMILGDVVKFLAAAFYSTKLLSSFTIEISKKLMKFYFITALPLGIALIFNTLMTQIDRLMLSVMVPALELGFYSLSYKLFDIALVIPTFFMNAAFPILVKRYAEKKNYSLGFTQSYFFLFIASIAITVFSIGLGWVFIPLVWGQEMVPSIITFNILMSGSILFYTSSSISWCFVIENKMKYLIYIYLSGFLLNFSLNIIAIRMYGYIGAAITTIITELVVLILLDTFRKKVLKANYVSFKKLNPREVLTFFKQ